MAKVKKAYFCQSCGYDSPKWLGKCPSCGEWNTFAEEIVSKSSAAPTSFGLETSKPLRIDEIDLEKTPRIALNSGELNRILGGGVVPGSLILIGGEPGIGKSTLSLQIALRTHGLKTLYVSGEESAQQIKLRAERLGGKNSDCLIYCETLVENIINQAQNVNPDLVVIDSIQTLLTDRIDSSPGSVSQIRETAAMLLRYAKQSSTPIFIIGHITKDGTIAGPKVLEHIVDVVLQFEGDSNHIYRLLRSAKNRFGSTAEMGIFEMTGHGLREVDNPSEMLVTQHDSLLSGIAITAALDGNRPFMIEVQALVSSAAYGTPQRSTTGFDIRRLNMLLAVLEKRVGFKLGAKDVFLNIAGGIKLADPCIDLAVISAVLSSNLDIPISTDVCFAAEVGLSGEIRPITRLDQRIAEAQRLGFKTIYISKYGQKGLNIPSGISVVFVTKVEELFRSLFNKNK